jgi:two-component system, OmpR family, phosphate regulon response regulator PhoB
MSKILIIEDEADLADTLAYNLRMEGHSTQVAQDGTSGLRLANGAPRPDLVLLDLMLPDMSGVEVCRQIRAVTEGARPSVIMVTARGEEIDRVVGFEVGADDYVVKPFSIRELMLRVRAVLRRAQGSEQSDESLKHGPFLIDEAAHRVWIDGEEYPFTALEFRLLSLLLRRRGKVQTREVLLADVWNMDPSVNTRTVDKHVQRLRHKLGPAADFVETIRGVGYRFRSSE